MLVGLPIHHSNASVKESSGAKISNKLVIIFSRVRVYSGRMLCKALCLSEADRGDLGDGPKGFEVTLLTVLVGGDTGSLK